MLGGLHLVAGEENGLRMSYRRWQLGNRAWAPRALAVISCALALLAAQPVAGKGSVGADRAVPVSVPAPAEARVASAALSAPMAMPRVSRRETPFFGSARRLHILATMEILKRLLVAELQPAPERLFLPELLGESTECIELVAAPLNLPGARGAPDYPSLPPPEHQFVLVHTQLSPPTV
jgi:hypothetical protein